MGIFVIDSPAIGEKTVHADRAAVDVAIIGGGATGVLLAIALGRHDPATRVLIVEPSDSPGAGLPIARPPISSGSMSAPHG